MLRTACAAAILMTAASAASAQTNPTPPAPAQQNASAEQNHNTQGLRQQMTANLKQSGFTDIKIVPDSFLVQAKDRSGNPVTLFLNPNSFTEVVALGDNGQAASSASGGEFVRIPANEPLEFETHRHEGL